MIDYVFQSFCSYLQNKTEFCGHRLHLHWLLYTATSHLKKFSVNSHLASADDVFIESWYLKCWVNASIFLRFWYDLKIIIFLHVSVQFQVHKGRKITQNDVLLLRHNEFVEDPGANIICEKGFNKNQHQKKPASNWWGNQNQVNTILDWVLYYSNFAACLLPFSLCPLCVCQPSMKATSTKM